MDKRFKSDELIIAEKELLFLRQEKESRAAELIIANKELVFQNQEKENRAAELIIANNELVFQNQEKENRAAELVIANKELVFQNQEKENRAAELVIANKELVFQNQEKENRAAELIIANKELVFQNQEKEDRAAELIIANKELVFQNQEKENRAAELVIANKELIFQNQEKEKRAAELIIANKELALQYEEKNIILESIDDAFFTVDKNWAVTYWNNQAEKVLGRSKNEIAGKVLWEVYTDFVDTPFYTFYFKAVEENKAQHFEAYYKTLNIWLEVSAYPSLKGLSVYFRDVTERLGYINTIEDQNAKLREIAFIQSHVVREPLARLMGLISLIKDPSMPNADNEELLGHLLSSANELDQKIRDVSNKAYYANLK